MLTSAKSRMSGHISSTFKIATVILLSVVAPGVYAERPPDGMVEIPLGIYEPLYKSSDVERLGQTNDSVIVQRFYLDERAVSNAKFLNFVSQNLKWQRSRLPGLFADDAYLTHWRGDQDYGDPKIADLPVVNVSWFAAMAFCRWQGKTLPTVAQWERAAGASELSEDGRKDPKFTETILQWYSDPADRPLSERSKMTSYRNLFGAWDMHGLIWEWTQDFNTAMVTGESRGDSGLQRQLFCGSGSIGAADPTDYASFMRFAFRSSLGGDYTVGSLGFRCALNPVE